MAASAENFDIRVLPTGTPRKLKMIIHYQGVQSESGRVVDRELPPSYDDLLVAATPDQKRQWRKEILMLPAPGEIGQWTGNKKIQDQNFQGGALS